MSGFEIDELTQELKRFAVISATYGGDMRRWKEEIGL
jgi:hypothetical protein